MADIIYLGTPCTFDPSIVELFLALQNGAAVLISHYTMRESPKRVLNALFPINVTTPGITVLQMTPSLFRQFGTNAIRNRILSSSSTLRWVANKKCTRYVIHLGLNYTFQSFTPRWRIVSI